MEMIRIDFILLSVLQKQEARSAASAMSLAEIRDAEPHYKTNTMYKRIMRMVHLGWLLRGMGDGNAHTYYITDAGIKAIERERNIL